MMELEAELLVKLLFIFGLLFLLWVWSFWKDVQDNNEFYPDGLEQCPQETYTILENDNSNSSRIRCLSCPVCPPGEEPSPPCGITLVRRAAGECTSCSPGTYSDETGSTACKVCSVCDSRKIINSCTAQKDTECKDCPLRHYEDDNKRTCKHCSSCCGKNYSAKLECFKSQKCKGNCTRKTNIMKKHFSTIFNRLVAKHINDPYNTTSISNGNSLRKEGEENSKLLESVIDYKQEDLTHLETKRDISVEVAAQEEYKDSTNSQTNFELLEIPEINKYVQEEADILGKKQDPSPTKNSTELTNTLVNEDREQTAPQTFPDKDFNSVQPTVSSPTTTESELGHLTPQSPKTLPSAAQTQLIVPGFFLSSFVGTIAAVLLLGLMGLLIYHVYKKRVNRMPKGYEKLGSTSKLEEGEDDSADELSDKEGRNELRDETAAATELEGLNLSEIPPDLEDILVMKLDVPHGAESQEFGWQKVGSAAGISRCELKYYEHLRGKNESPTKLLLDKLGSQGRTVSYLIDVLQKPRVDLDNVAKTIRHRVARI
ncbi:uncharacterized protein LOC110065806 [Orbicella faveolata]|uniref:uncharacterized protein LOC110065806 n=1 Tax=Orbicella faveolata TaxID=48498 RepID=UPI0009E32144|nr:uncharacterized protein LOC110065806 [Orbicella faveolata]